MKIEVNAKEFRRLSQQRVRDAAKVRAKAAKPKVVRQPVKPDRGRVIDKTYRAWIRRQPCAVGPLGCDGPIEAAHLRFSDYAAGRQNPGMGRKSDDDKWLTPLCRFHHQHDQHRRSERAFWAAHGVDPNALAIALRKGYESEETTTKSAGVEE